MKKFNKEFNGYNREEVNSFLNDVINQTEKILSKLQKQQSEMALLKEKLVHYQDIERSLNIALSNAEASGESIRKIARSEANIIVEEARTNANRIINDALIRNERIEYKNANMEKNLRVFKRKLRSIVEQQLEIVEEIEILEVDG